MRDLTLCIVGAGGSYTPEIVAGVLDRDAGDLPVTALSLTDSDPARPR